MLDKNGLISFSLNILRQNREIISSLKFCSLNNILLETDSPYMRVEGRESLPWDIKRVYEFTASVKNIDYYKLENQVNLNINRVFTFDFS